MDHVSYTEFLAFKQYIAEQFAKYFPDFIPCYLKAVADGILKEFTFPCTYLGTALVTPMTPNASEDFNVVVGNDLITIKYATPPVAGVMVWSCLLLPIGTLIESLTVPKAIFTVNAGPDQSGSQTTINLIGSAYYNLSGILSRSWSLIAGPTPVNFDSTQIDNVNVSGLSGVGEYLFEYSVLTVDGKSKSDRVSFNRVGVGASMTLNVGADQVLPYGTVVTHLKPVATIPSNWTYGNPKYEITQISGPTTATTIVNDSLNNIAVTDMVSGTYQFQVKVNGIDDSSVGKVVTDSISVTILSANVFNTLIEQSNPNATSGVTIQGVTATFDTVDVISPWIKFEFGAITAPSGAATTMEIYIDGSLRLSLDFPDVYVGTMFKLTIPDSNYSGGQRTVYNTFKSGTYNYLTVISGTGGGSM